MVASTPKPPWKKRNPAKRHKALTQAQKAQAKARAEAAGRRSPDLVDNLSVARHAKDPGQ